jgi:hypothetical protein
VRHEQQSSALRITSNTSPIAEQSRSTLISTAFVLEDFLPDLEDIICGQNDIEKDIPIRQVRANPVPKRIVLDSFNEEATIRRGVVNYDCQENKIDAKNPLYKAYRRAFPEEQRYHLPNEMRTND